ncbi:MAG: ATP-dependent Clp protease ATP-binding subunit ClpA [Bdellovibrionota bacterium]
MFDKDSESILSEAVNEAANRGHEYVCVEHLLWGIVQNKSGEEVIEACGGELPALKRKLEDFFETKLERFNSGKGGQPHQTIGFQRVLQRAVLHTEYSSSKIVTPGDLLAALLTESDSHAVYFLNEQGISRLDVLEFISHGAPLEIYDSADPDSDPEGDEPHENTKNPLGQFTTDLTLKAAAGELDPLVGRAMELDRIIHILCRRNKNNPLFVGDQGVGKTALAEGLAQRVVDGEVPARLLNLKIYSLDLGALLAGTRFRGDFEQRLKGVLKALEKEPNAVLFIDEIHTIIGAGATSGGTLDAANLLKPVLTQGKLRFMGSTTFEEYKNHFEKDKALARRFLKVDVLEPSVTETIEILKGLKEHFERHHGVKYSASALKAAAELSAKYINERFLPDKAIDVLDEAGAMVSLQASGSQETEKSEQESGENDADETAKSASPVRVSHIEKVIAKIARIPPRTVSTSDREKLKELKSQLQQVVFGQDEAISALTLSIRRSRAGLSAEQKPVGSFLFAGPTGVGKTEVARQLAKVLGLELIRFDMSEYMEKHTVARLIGAPPGYVGFEQGGLLTDAIIRNPHAVLLLDEIEKAHPDLFNILLQVMDHATLTDHTGRKADFRNVIIIMTSNVGSENVFGSPIGFGASAANEVGQGAIDKTFRPEFRNRLDAIIKFRPLPEEVVEKVVDKFIVEIDTQLLARKSTIVLTPAARRWLAQKGYNAQYGARSVHRLIQSELKDKLADELLFGKLSNGGTAKVDIVDDKIAISFEAREEQNSSKRPSRRKEVVPS